MKTALATWKLARLAAHIAQGQWTVAFGFPKFSAAQKEHTIKAWALDLLKLIDINLIVKGTPPGHGPVLLAANHISWLDMIALMASCPNRFVAKAEVRRWPLLGGLAAATGTLFVTRESPRDAVRVVHQMAEHLKADEVLTIFPEGTTSNGVQLLPFHANLFQAAISANAPVQPVALQFSDVSSGLTSLAPCYINDDTLLQSLWRTLKAPPLCAVVSFGEPQRPCGRDRRALARETQAAVEALRKAT
ncbi:lysophospholipid acyltransferase family protein [Rhodoferax sp.]|uniref:lysophospholipid acyltransferase family protein n=1 Tax=Rhodoferax sp. TaxID=50421 RepID=UPI00283EC172|nr:lysophospholipid acyltransferase family protein [Rhodoferax sp.]MDR3370971.1 lysophospholipid acyltransferase family protein [Rhodoferax sp.]